MEESSDFVADLGIDISIKILRFLDDPSDLRHASAVSTSWRRCVIENRLFKSLCLQIFPQLSDIHLPERENDLAMEHTMYSSLARSMTSSELARLVDDAISASSTDHYYEGIENTLISEHQIGGRQSYWSSIGETDPQVPESLVYKLVSDFCVVTEIHVQPHQGYEEEEEEFGCLIYSAEAVKFRLGCDFYSSGHEAGNFVWTYTSPEFPMIQRATVQKFVLPEPVLCIGGIMQIELLGRSTRHPLDDMYYVGVRYVQALGRNLSPQFDVEFIDESGSCILKHNPDTQLLGRIPELQAGADHLEAQSGSSMLSLFYRIFGCFSLKKAGNLF